MPSDANGPEDGPLSKEERIEVFGERKAEHAEWWAQEMGRVEEVRNDLVAVIENRDDTQLAKTGKSVGRSGEHTVRLEAKVAGEPWEPTRDGEERDIYLCGGCDYTYERPTGDHTKRCPHCGTEVGYEETEVRTVVF